MTTLKKSIREEKAALRRQLEFASAELRRVQGAYERLQQEAEGLANVTMDHFTLEGKTVRA